MYINIHLNIAAFLQDVVYKLSKIGEALEKNDISTATSVLGSSKDTEWLKNVNSALSKVLKFDFFCSLMCSVASPSYPFSIPLNL